MRTWVAIVATVVATALAVQLVEVRAQDKGAPTRIDMDAEKTRVAFCAFANAIDQGTALYEVPPEVMARFTLASSWNVEDLESVEALRAFFRIYNKAADGSAKEAATKTGEERAAGQEDVMETINVALACSGALGTASHQLRVGAATDASATLRKTLDVVRAFQAARAADAKKK